MGEPWVPVPDVCSPTLRRKNTIYVYVCIHMYILYIYIYATINIWYVACIHQFLGSVLSFSKFWKSMCISYIFHCILMVFLQRVKYFLTLSNVAQSCETLGHSFFFMELTPPLAQPPLSHHYRQQPLSPTTVATTASTPSHEILIFTSSTLNF